MQHSILIHPIPVLKDNYVWAIIDSEDGKTLVVDPGDAKPVLDFLKKDHLTLCGIMLTHHHWDHTAGVAEIITHRAVPVFSAQHENLPEVKNHTITLNHFPLSFEIMPIPGHTLDHVAYYSSSQHLFCGDTLFAAGCGRVFEGTPTQMYTSLQKLAALPNETLIYCGHEYTLNNLRFAEIIEPGNSKIKERIAHITELRKKNLPSLPALLAEEKETNPFLRCEIPAVITHVEHYAKQSLATPVEVFTWLRKWKNEF